MKTINFSNLLLKMREARFWLKMKFEPIFFQVLWQFFNPKGSLLRQRRTGAAGGRGVRGEFRPPYKSIRQAQDRFWAKSVRIFSNAHRQLGNVFVGSPEAKARQPILSANWNFLSLPRRGWPKAGFPNFHF
jgi:hypothetical protein